jgi:hypothetical protein
MGRTPSVGDTVHYVSYGTPGGEYSPECRAAIVTAVSGHTIDGVPVVSLAVLNPTGMFFNQGVVHERMNYGGTWHWPETPVES